MRWVTCRLHWAGSRVWVPHHLRIKACLLPTERRACSHAFPPAPPPRETAQPERAAVQAGGMGEPTGTQPWHPHGSGRISASWLTSPTSVFSSFRQPTSLLKKHPVPGTPVALGIPWKHRRLSGCCTSAVSPQPHWTPAESGSPAPPPNSEKPSGGQRCGRCQSLSLEGETGVQFAAS